METLTPPVLSLARELLWKISSGQSMREAMRTQMIEDSSPFAMHMREWWMRQLQSPEKTNLHDHFKNPYHMALAEIIVRGSAGQPILEILHALTCEIERIAEDSLEIHIQTLPFKQLIPLLIFQFPAFLLLLVGPLLRELQAGLGG